MTRRHRSPSAGNTESRLTRVEAVVESLAKQVGDFIEANSRTKGEIFDRMEDLQRDVSASRVTNWPLIVSVLGIGVLLVGMMASLVMFANQASVNPFAKMAETNAAAIQALQTSREINGWTRSQHQDWVSMHAAEEATYRRSIDKRLEILGEP